MIALLRALEGHAEAKAQGGAGAAAALARRNHLSSPTLGMIWDICGQVARELMGLGLPAAYDWCVNEEIVDSLAFLDRHGCCMKVAAKMRPPRGLGVSLTKNTPSKSWIHSSPAVNNRLFLSPALNDIALFLSSSVKRYRK